MRIRWRAGTLLAVLLALWVWLYRVPLGFANGPVTSELPGAEALARWLDTSTGRVPQLAASAAKGGLRKCLSGTEVLYTQGHCPAGSRELALTGGTVNVMPSPVGVAPAASGHVGPPHARDLLLKPDAVNIKEQRMEAIIGK